MKKLVTMLLILALAVPCLAGTFTVSYNDAHQARIVEGLTQDGDRCNQGETTAECVRRLIAWYIKDQVKRYEDARDEALVNNPETEIS